VLIVRRALELALFMDAKLDVSKVPADQGAMTGNPISIFDVALRHTRTVEVYIDRLQQLGANREPSVMGRAAIAVCS
jgi:hypothetical protein